MQRKGKGRRKRRQNLEAPIPTETVPASELLLPIQECPSTDTQPYSANVGRKQAWSDHQGQQYGHPGPLCQEPGTLTEMLASLGPCQARDAQLLEDSGRYGLQSLE